MAACTFSTLRIVPNSTDDAVESYRDSIRILERHLDGEDTGLTVDTYPQGVVSAKFRVVSPMTRDHAREILVRELRRYADFLEKQVCYSD